MIMDLSEWALQARQDDRISPYALKELEEFSKKFVQLQADLTEALERNITKENTVIRDLLKENTEAREEIERYDTAFDEIGIYPRRVSGRGDGYEERTGWMNGWNACIMLIRIRLAELAEGKDFSKARQRILDACGGKHNPELMIDPRMWFDG